MRKPKKTQQKKSVPNPPVMLGAHFSIAGGLHKALYAARDYGCTAVQIFTKNASTWKERVLTDADVASFDQARAETGITAIAAHTAYLINLGSPDPDKFDRACTALSHEMHRSARLGIPWVVHHPGAHMKAGEAAGISRIASGINRVLDATGDDGPQLLLETCAGQGTTLGHTFGQLAAIAEKVDRPHRIGFCLDTCHIFAAGYDIRTEAAYQETMAAFDAILGLDRLHLLHLNDARRKLGSKIDRHAHIGKGQIGPEGFSLIMNDRRLAHIPKILETPKKEGDVDWDRRNLDCLTGMLDYTRS
jgi:deoxyribonuclease IV